MLEVLRNMTTEIAWPAALLIAWLAGEAGHRWFALPRISTYGIAGFAMAASQGGFLDNPSGGGSMKTVADPTKPITVTCSLESPRKRIGNISGVCSFVTAP